MVVVVYILIVLITRSLCTADEYMGFFSSNSHKFDSRKQKEGLIG